MLKRFDFDSPESALGEVLTLTDRFEEEKLEIVGVVKEFQYVKVHSRTEPCAIIQAVPDDYQHLNLLVKTDEIVPSQMYFAWKSSHITHFMAVKHLVVQ